MDGGLDHVEGKCADRPDGLVRTDLAPAFEQEKDNPALPARLDLDAAPECCPHCASKSVCRWGRSSPPREAQSVAQRWRCRSCSRTYSARTGTVLAGIHAPHKFRAMIVDMLGSSPSSCRRLAKVLELGKMTIWAWRMKASAAFARGGPAMPSRPVAMDRLVVRESRKASRMWVNHAREPHRYPKPDRLRWLDYRRRGITPPDRDPRYRIPIGLVLDERNSCAAVVLPVDTVMATPWRLPPSPTSRWQAEKTAASGYPNSRVTGPSYRSATPADDPAACEPPRLDHAGHASLMTELRNGFRHFLAPFCGPATSYLPAYAAWFTARLAAGPGAPQAS